MLVGVYKEIRPWPAMQDSQPKIIGPVGAGDGYEAAREIAKSKAENFDHSGYEGEFDYWWGRNEGAQELHCYVIGAS